MTLEGERVQPRIPMGLHSGWRILIAMAMVAFFAASVTVARGLIGGFGFSVAGVLLLAVAALAAGVILLPMAMVVDFPRAIWGHWLPERRWRAGRCPSCGYGARGGGTPLIGALCPECAAPFARPIAYASEWGTLWRGMRLAIPAWLVGCILGLGVIGEDEGSFEADVAASRAREPTLAQLARRRGGLARFAFLEWSAERGFESHPPFETPKMRIPPRVRDAK